MMGNPFDGSRAESRRTAIEDSQSGAGEIKDREIEDLIDAIKRKDFEALGDKQALLIRAAASDSEVGAFLERAGVGLLSKGRVKDFFELYRLADLEPDWDKATIRRAVMDNFENITWDWESFMEVRRLSQRSGIDFYIEWTPDKIRSFLKEGLARKYYDEEDEQDVSGVDFLYYLKRDCGLEVEDWTAYQKEMDEACLAYLVGGDVPDLLALINITEILPTGDDKLKKAFDQYVDSFGFDIEELKELSSALGLRPDQAVLKSRFTNKKIQQMVEWRDFDKIKILADLGLEIDFSGIIEGLLESSRDFEALFDLKKAIPELRLSDYESFRVALHNKIDQGRATGDEETFDKLTILGRISIDEGVELDRANPLYSILKKALNLKFDHRALEKDRAGIGFISKTWRLQESLFRYAEETGVRVYLNDEAWDGLLEAVSSSGFFDSSYNLTELVGNLRLVQLNKKQERNLAMIVEGAAREFVKNNDTVRLEQIVSSSLPCGIEDIVPLAWPNSGVESDYYDPMPMLEWLQNKGKKFVPEDWTPEAKSRIEVYLLKTAKKRDFSSYARLQEITGVALDWERPDGREQFERIWLDAVTGKEPGADDECFKRPLNVDDPKRDLGALVALAGISVDPEKFRTEIERHVGLCLDHLAIGQASAALEKSGLRIDWNGSNFREAFEKAALSFILEGKESWSYGSYALADKDLALFENISGRKFDCEAHRAEIENNVARYISSGDLDCAIGIMKRSGMNFDLTGPLFMEAFDRASEKVLLSANVGYRKKLEDLFALKINPEKFRQRIEEAVATAVFHDGNMSRAKALYETTGIKPDFEQEPHVTKVLKYYREKLLRMRQSSASVNVENFLRSVDFFGVDPKRDLHGELELVVSGFVSEGKFPLFDKLNETLGLGRSAGEDVFRPILNAYYGTCLERCDDEALRKAIQITGVEPDLRDKHLSQRFPQFFFGLLKKGDMASIRDWAKRSGADVASPEFWFSAMSCSKIDSTWVKGVADAAEKVFAGTEQGVLQALKSAMQKMVDVEDVSPGLIFALHEHFRIKPDVAAAKRLVLNTSWDKDQFRKCLSLIHENGLVLEFDDADFEGVHCPRNAALIYSRFAPKDRSKKEALLNALAEKKYWYKALPDLLELRGPSMNPDFCPWANMIGPLAESVDINDDEGLESFVEYCREFGLAKLPKLCSTVIDLKRTGKKLGKGEEFCLRSDSLEYLREWDTSRGGIFGIGDGSDWTPEKSEKVVQALKESVQDVIGAIFEDRMPQHLLGSNLEMDLLNAVIPVWGNYGRYDDRRELILRWSQACKKEETKKPPEFMGCGQPGRKRRMVSLKERDEGLFTDGEKEQALTRLAERREEILKDNALMEFLAPLQRALKTRNESPVAQPALFFATMLEGAKSKIEKAKEALVKARENGPAGKIRAMEAGLLKQEESYARIVALSSWDGIRAIFEKSLASLSDYSLADALEKAELSTASQKKRLADFIKDRDRRELKEDERKHFDSIEKQIKKELAKAQDTVIRLKRDAAEADKIHRLLSSLDAAGAFDMGADESRSENLDYLRSQAMLEAAFISLGDAAMSLGRDEIGRLIMNLAALESGGHAAAAQAGEIGTIDEDSFRAWSEWYAQELLTHFTDPDNSHEIRRVPFTDTAMKNIRQIFGIGNKGREYLMAMQDKREGRRSDHPVVRIASLLANNDAVKEKMLGNDMETAGDREVVFYTCHGLGRVFSGDIANACYDKLRGALADGEYPDLDAVIMAEQSQDKKETSILGSYLLIRARDLSQRQCLIIRALNPKEQVVQREVTPESVLTTVIEDTIDLATAGSLDRVLLCVDDHSGGHGTNRTSEFEAMRKMAYLKGWKLSDMLEKKPETTFNNYAIYNAKNEQVYVVWDAGHDVEAVSDDEKPEEELEK